MAFVSLGGVTRYASQRSAVSRRRSERRVVCAAKEFRDFGELEDAVKKYLAGVERSGGVEVDENEELPSSPIAYKTLAKRGRFDILEGVMKFGGYIEVSRKLGLDVVVPERKVEEVKKVVFKRTSPSDGDGFLTLGGAKADRLSETGVTTAMKLAEEKRVQKLLDAERRAKQQKDRPVFDSKYFITRLGKYSSGAKEEKKAEGETLKLSSIERLELVFEAAFLAAAFGRLGADYLDIGTRHTLQNLVYGGAAFHTLLGVYARSLAQQKNRDGILWFFKVSVIGAGSLLRLRSLPDLPAKSSTKASENPVA
mmetsp:Transcript_6572/g.19924  ORF Transcript_6572/g.19924 Transcript_6572/m.19924 type:complete len:310 (+) Transcript_6572:50-979(+)